MIKGIGEEIVIEKTENIVVLEVFIASNCDYFDGHFPNFKLLPAVAEFTLVEKFAQKYFGMSSFVPLIPRMKFSSPLLPDTKVRFHLTRDNNKITFEITNMKDKKISTGSFYA